MEQKVIIYDPALCTGCMEYVVSVNGDSVVQCLEQLGDQLPDVKNWLFRKDGNLSSLVEIYINHENVCGQGLSKPVKDGDEIFVQMMISFN